MVSLIGSCFAVELGAFDDEDVVPSFLGLLSVPPPQPDSTIGSAKRTVKHAVIHFLFLIFLNNLPAGWMFSFLPYYIRQGTGS
ncbi:hypothetical protein D3C75_1124740 [compost metagenome]